MADTDFVPGTVITSDWLNDINDKVYGLADATNAGKGAGQVGRSSATTYPSDTVGYALMLLPEVIATSGVAATNTYKLQSLIDQASSDGGGVVRVSGVFPISGRIYAKSNVTIELAPGSNIIQQTDGIPAITNWSGAVGYALSNFRIVGPGTISKASNVNGASDMEASPIFFAGGTLTDVLIDGVKVFGGEAGIVMLGGGNNYGTRRCQVSGVKKNGIWLGDYAAASSVVFSDADYVHDGCTEGSGIVLYNVTEGRSERSVLRTLGGVSAGSNQYHSIYVKLAKRVIVTGAQIDDQRNGYGIHVYNPPSDPYVESVLISGCTINKAPDQGCIRVSRAKKVVIEGVVSNEAGTNHIYATDCESVSIESDVILADGARRNLGTSPLNAAVHLDGVKQAKCSAQSVDNALSGVSAQIVGVYATNCEGLDLSGMQHRWATAGGYYLADIGAGVEDLTVIGAKMTGCSTLINGDPNDATIIGNQCFGNSNSDIIASATDPYHRFVIKGNINQSAPFRKESDGVNLTEWAGAAPTSGTYAVGDVTRVIAPAAGGFIGWVCTIAGAPGTHKTFGNIAA